MLFRRTLTLLFLLYSAFAQAEPQSNLQKTIWTAHILRQTKQPPITALELITDKVPVLMAPKDGRIRPLIEIGFKYDRPGWTLLTANGRPAARGKEPGTYAIHAYMNGKLNELVLQARGPAGELEHETMYIYAPEAQEFRLVSPWEEILVSAGLSNMAYSQTSFGRFASFSGVVSANYFSPNRTSRFGEAADLMLTMLTIKTSPIYRSPQMLEAKLDATYLLNSDVESRWRAHVLLGASYLTMIANDSPFGFANLTAPEVGTRIRRILNDRQAWIFDARYVALKTDFAEHGLDFSLGFSWLLKNSHRAEVDLGFSNYTYNSDSETKIDYDLLTLKFGISI